MIQPNKFCSRILGFSGQCNVDGAGSWLEVLIAQLVQPHIDNTVTHCYTHILQSSCTANLGLRTPAHTAAAIQSAGWVLSAPSVWPTNGGAPFLQKSRWSSSQLNQLALSLIGCGAPQAREPLMGAGCLSAYTAVQPLMFQAGPLHVWLQNVQISGLSLLFCFPALYV